MWDRPMGIDRLLAKRVVLPAVLLGAALLLVAASQTWVQGTVTDAVLGRSSLRGQGSDVAQGVFAAAFVGGACVLAAGTAGRIARIVAGIAMVLAGGLCLGFIVRLAADPGAALGRLAAQMTGRTGSVSATGDLTAWPWAAAVGSVLIALGGVAVLVAHRRWSGLSNRYDAPSAPGPRPAGGGGDSAWDQMSRGEDPT